MATTSSSSFQKKLDTRIAAVHSLLCVGLDPHEGELFPQGVPENTTDADKCKAAFEFCKTLIDQTTATAACYKPNAAFFEALGDGGLETLKRVIDTVIPNDIPVLLDVKRGDIGSTASAYAAACYDYLHADAVTLSPLMGWDSVKPFVTGKYANKGAFLLCKTSNPGSNDLLALDLKTASSKLYERIGSLVGNEWSSQAGDNVILGLVVGATDAEAIKRARAAAGDSVWILAPGVGAQGGNLEEALRAGLNTSGSGILIPVSRGISKAEDPAKAADDLRQKIETVRKELVEEMSRKRKEVSTSILPYQKEFLEFSLKQGVLKFGSFVLKSGRTSPYFFNAGLFATGAALHKLGKAYASTIMSSSSGLVEGTGKDAVPKFDVVFGPAYKGISLGAVVSSALYSDFGVDVGFAYNRKEAKDHGEGGTLVGASLQGKRVLVVDDVITAGTAIREAHVMLKEVEAEPVGVVIALDRAEIRSLEDKVSAVQAAARDLSLRVVSIVNLKELQAFLEDSPDYDDATLQSVIDYRQEYGASE